MPDPVLEATQARPAQRLRRPIVHMALAIGVAGVIAGNGWLTSDTSTDAGVRRQESGAIPNSEAGVPKAMPVVQVADEPAGEDGQRTTDDEPQANSDEQFRQAVLGTWYRDDYYGRCILDIKEGGKGQMTVVFSSYYAYLLASRVDAVLEWTIEDGRALFKTVSGKPEAAYAIIAREKGEDRDRKIAEISERRLILVDDQDDGSVATWARAKSLAEAVKVE